MLSRLASPTAEAMTAKKIIERTQIFPNGKKVVRKIQTPSNVLVFQKTTRPRRINGGWDLSLVEGGGGGGGGGEGGAEMLFFKFVFSIIIVIRISDLIYSYNHILSTNFKIRKADIFFAEANFKSDFFNSHLRIEKNSHKRIFMSNRAGLSDYQILTLSSIHSNQSIDCNV